MNKIEKKFHTFTIIEKRFVPKSYINLAKLIEIEAKKLAAEKKAPLLTDENIWDLIKNLPKNDIEIGDFEELGKAVKILEETGILLHFSQSVKAQQTGFYYLNPGWIADRISTLISKWEE